MTFSAQTVSRQVIDAIWMKAVMPVEDGVGVIASSSSLAMTAPILKLKTILIAVADGMGGYGDFLFAFKLADQLRNKYVASGLGIPSIYLISQPSGKLSMKHLKADIEFGFEILTPQELKGKIKAREIDVGLLIESPVFTYELIDEIDAALALLQGMIPLIMVTEYGQNSSVSREDFACQQTYRTTQCKHIQFTKMIYSGFSREADEQGILVSDALLHPASAEILVNQLDEKIRTSLLMGLDLASYQSTKSLSMQYSHDFSERSVRLQKTSAHHFLKVHSEFCKTHDKAQDIVMVGKDMVSKKNALMEIKDKLMADGFTRVSFFNADTSVEEVYYESDVPGKTYRVVYTSGMTHASMMACMALSGPLTGATGDQSLSEALSANKMMIYECLSHKKEFINNYDVAMVRIAQGDPDVSHTLMLLRTADNDVSYQQLGEYLRNPVIQEKLQHCNQILLKQYDLVAQVKRVDEPLQAISSIEAEEESVEFRASKM